MKHCWHECQRSLAKFYRRASHCETITCEVLPSRLIVMRLITKTEIIQVRSPFRKFEVRSAIKRMVSRENGASADSRDSRDYHRCKNGVSPVQN